MPVEERQFNEAPDNAERSALRDSFARQGAIRVVDVAAAVAVTVVNMRAIGLSGRHVRVTNIGANPLAYFFEAKSAATPPVQTIPNSAVRATYDAAGNQTANPPTQATLLAVGASARRWVSGKFPMLQMNGVGGVTTVELEDATI